MFVIGIVVELFARHLEVNITPPEGRAGVEALRGLAPSTRVSPHPYLLYQNTPGYAADGYRQHDRQGYRGRRRRGGPVVLALGGSTTYGHLLPNPEDAWPARLARLTGADVVNGGLNYATSAELLAHWAFRDRFLVPSVVIVHGPGNDTAPLLFDDYDPEYTKFRRGWERAPARAGERWILGTGLGRVAYAWWLQLSPGGGLSWEPFPMAQLGHDQALANVRRHEPVGFRRNLEELLASVQRSGARPVYFEFVLAPKAVYAGRRLSRGARYAEAAYDAIAEGCEKERKAAREVAARLGVEYLVMPPPPVERFLDHCHLDPEGEQLKAAFLAERLRLSSSTSPSCRRPR